MRTRGQSGLRINVRWDDAERTTLLFVVLDPNGGCRASFFVRLADLLAELSRLGVWGTLIKEENDDTRNR